MELPQFRRFVRIRRVSVGSPISVIRDGKPAAAPIKPEFLRLASRPPHYLMPVRVDDPPSAGLARNRSGEGERHSVQEICDLSNAVVAFEVRAINHQLDRGNGVGLSLVAYGWRTRAD